MAAPAPKLQFVTSCMPNVVYCSTSSMAHSEPGVFTAHPARCEYCGRYGALGRCDGCGANNAPLRSVFSL